MTGSGLDGRWRRRASLGLALALSVVSAGAAATETQTRNGHVLCTAIHTDPPGAAVDPTCGLSDLEPSSSGPAMNVSAERQEGTDVLATWEWNDENGTDERNVSEYQILAGASPWSLQQVDTVDNETFSYHDEDAISQQKVWYQVQALDSEGDMMAQSWIVSVQVVEWS